MTMMMIHMKNNVRKAMVVVSKNPSPLSKFLFSHVKIRKMIYVQCNIIRQHKTILLDDCNSIHYFALWARRICRFNAACFNIPSKLGENRTVFFSGSP